MNRIEFIGRYRYWILASIMLTLIAPRAFAQDSGYSHSRGGIYLGAFITKRDSQTRFDSDTDTGTVIDLEGDLSLENTTTVARFGGHYWLKPRHRLDLSYFDLSRTASRRIDETIEFGDEIFEVDTTVFSEFDLNITKADYTFAAINRTKGYLGITGGLYVAQTKFALSEATAGTAESETVTLPLPVIGLRGEYQVRDRILINGSMQWFEIDTGDASGRLRDLFVGAEYQLTDRMGVGIGYNEVAMNIDVSETNGFKGSVDWGYDGWLAFFRANFGQSN